jgi:hypothetical protein
VEDFSYADEGGYEFGSFRYQEQPPSSQPLHQAASSAQAAHPPPKRRKQSRFDCAPPAALPSPHYAVPASAPVQIARGPISNKEKFKQLMAAKKARLGSSSDGGNYKANELNAKDKDKFLRLLGAKKQDKVANAVAAIAARLGGTIPAPAPAPPTAASGSSGEDAGERVLKSTLDAQYTKALMSRGSTRGLGHASAAVAAAEAALEKRQEIGVGVTAIPAGRGRGKGTTLPAWMTAPGMDPSSSAPPLAAPQVPAPTPAGFASAPAPAPAPAPTPVKYNPSAAADLTVHHRQKMCGLSQPAILRAMLARYIRPLLSYSSHTLSHTLLS